VVEPLLPIERLEVEGEGTPLEYIYDEPPQNIFGGLLPRHVEAQIFRALLEAAASEHGARMTAMEAATTNASEVIENLTLHANKVRQASITRELIEVVSGAAATGK
jgi:F-type H+-transporting ATPase subunit gamma